MSTDPSDVENTDLSDLTLSEKGVLQDWENLFTSKYPHIGDVVANIEEKRQKEKEEDERIAAAQATAALKATTKNE